MIKIEKILEDPEYLKGKTIICYKSGDCQCPFWDDGDSGYGSHCNLLSERKFQPDIVKEQEEKANKIHSLFHREKKISREEWEKMIKPINEILEEMYYKNFTKYCPLRNKK